MKEHIVFLKKLHACADAIVWAEKFDSLAEAWDACERVDWMWWLLRKAELVTKVQSVTYEVWCAERALPRWTAKYPSDDRPAIAIAAARAWIDNPCQQTAHAAADAAYAAYAAYADVAAHTANTAYAAYVAAAADAAYAAYADVDAAAHTANTAYAADEVKAQVTETRRIFGNPFKK
jgi:hypothetical protein